MPLDFVFRARIWLYEGPGSWHFITLPSDVSTRLHSLASGRSKVGGSLPVVVTIGSTRWKTSIFRDRKRNTYLLPIKSAVRSKEQLRVGDSTEVALIAELDAED